MLDGIVMHWLFVLMLWLAPSAGGAAEADPPAVGEEPADPPAVGEEPADPPPVAEPPAAPPAVGGGPAAPPVGVEEPAETQPTAPTWGRRTVPASGISVELPGAVEVRHAERSTPVGRVLSDTLVVEPSGGWMAATVTHAPRFALRFAGSSTVMKQARNSVLEDTGGVQVSWDPIVRDGRDGMRLVFTATSEDGQPQQGVSEVYTYDGLVITLTAALEPRTAALARRFHDSISFP